MILKKVLKTLAVLTILPALFLMLRRWWRRKKIRERIMADGESDYRKTASNIANSIAKATNKDGPISPNRMASPIRKG